MAKLTSGTTFVYQVKTPTEGWITASNYRAACLISSRIGEAVRKNPALKGQNFGKVREVLV